MKQIVIDDDLWAWMLQEKGKSPERRVVFNDIVRELIEERKNKKE